MLGIGILIPIIPALFTNTASEFYMLTTQTTSQAFMLLGLMSAAYPVMQFFAAPVLGDLSDHYGRKPVLAVSSLGTVVGYLLFIVGLFIHSLPVLFLSRIIDGITGGNISVAQAAIADITPPENRAKNFGLMGAAFGVGFILGPSLGGILGNYNTSYPFILAALLSSVSFVLIRRVLPETIQNKTVDRKPFTLSSAVTGIMRGFRHPTLSKLFVTTLCFSAGFTFFTSFFGAFLIQRFHFSEQAIGLYFAFVGVWIVITQGFINRRVSGKYSNTVLVLVPLIILACMLIAFSLAPSAWVLYAIVPVFAISNGLITANLSAHISRSSGASNQGEILGINASMSSFSQATVPLIAGFVAASFSVATPILFGAIMVFIAAGVFALSQKK